MPETSIPEVKTINEGIRNVDIRDFTKIEEIDTFLQDYDFIDSGMEAIVLKSKIEPEIILRLELYNSLGKSWMLNLLRKLSSSDDSASHKEKYEDALAILNDDGIYNLLAQSVRERVTERVAAHNSQFRRDPTSTIPINQIYSFKGQPFAVRMKYLEGEAIDENDEALKRQIALTYDGNPNNTLTNIKNSPHKTQLIDLKKFIPSNKKK